MLYNGENVSEYIPDEACEVCCVRWCSMLNECPVALFRGSVVSVCLCIDSFSHGQGQINDLFH
jgi:hypothetical protein